ncbi:hypothetical protein ACGFZQ_49770 [Streptomyces sp. NPDC048254]|uniref:hypothetical protein n=1 Tax=Streptomyces sp. NPDC048254 TaxID=3365525 RepID=UPI003713D973
MPPEPALPAARRTVSPLDHHIEAVTGHDIDTLWDFRDRGVLDDPHAHLVARHRELATAQTGVTFYLRLLNRLSSGEFDVDDALFTRIDRTAEQLEEAADARDAAALEPIEAAAAPDAKQLSTDDQAALLATAGGAKLYEHLLTGRMSVSTASGTRIPHAKLLRLEDTGLVVRDTGHPVHAGQPASRPAGHAHRRRTSRAVRRSPDPRDAVPEGPSSPQHIAVGSGATALIFTEGPYCLPPNRRRSGRPFPRSTSIWTTSTPTRRSTSTSTATSASARTCSSPSPNTTTGRTAAVLTAPSLAR